MKHNRTVRSWAVMVIIAIMSLGFKNALVITAFEVQQPENVHWKSLIKRDFFKEYGFFKPSP